MRPGETEVERYQAAQRGTANSRVRRSIERAICLIHPRLQLLDEQAAIEVSLASAQIAVGHGGVFLHARDPGVVYSHNDQGLDDAFLDQPVAGGLHIPEAALDKAGRAIEQVLAILQIEHRIASPGLEVIRRQSDDDIPSGWEKLRDKLPVQPQPLASTHQHRLVKADRLQHGAGSRIRHCQVWSCGIPSGFFQIEWLESKL